MQGNSQEIRGFKFLFESHTICDTISTQECGFLFLKAGGEEIWHYR